MAEFLTKRTCPLMPKPERVKGIITQGGLLMFYLSLCLNQDKYGEVEVILTDPERKKLLHLHLFGLVKIDQVTPHYTLRVSC